MMLILFIVEDVAQLYSKGLFTPVTQSEKHVGALSIFHKILWYP